MGTRLVAALAVLACTLHAADPLYESAQRKLDALDAHTVPRGGSVSFTRAEINAWARVRVPQIVPEGLRDQRVELGNGTATGYAVADFLKMRQAKGEATNWFFAKLIEGERSLVVSVRLESGGGRCTVHLTRVEISHAVASSTVLDFLVKTFFMPLYPDAHINEPFDLGDDVDRIDVRPSGVVVTVKK
jgi:hypothetical protein